MQIVLRHIATKLVFQEDWRWTFSPLEARQFESPLKAYRFAKEKAFEDVEVVVLLPDGRLGGSLPVG
jgi:hypothetical protein